MLAALLHHGFDALGFDIKPASEFGPLSSKITNDPATFGEGLTTLVSVVRDIAQTESLLFGEQALIAQAPALETLVISSTVSPRYLADLRARIPDKMSLIDAPMSGAAIAAEERRLSFMLGGTSNELDRLQPVFAAMGRHFHRMGPFGSGMQAKVLNNLLAASNTVMTRLVLDWTRAVGLDHAAMLTLIESSSGQNWLASGFQEIEFAQDGYTPDNSLGILKKDVESALDAAPEDHDQRLPQLLAELVAELKPFTD